MFYSSYKCIILPQPVTKPYTYSSHTDTSKYETAALFPITNLVSLSFSPPWSQSPASSSLSATLDTWGRLHPSSDLPGATNHTPFLYFYLLCTFLMAFKTSVSTRAVWVLGLSPTSAKTSSGYAGPGGPEHAPPPKPPQAAPDRASSDHVGPGGQGTAPPPMSPPAALALAGHAHGSLCSGPASGADTGERNTHRGGAGAAGPETYLVVLEGSWGGRGCM